MVLVTMALPATAEVIYSNHLNTAIPLDFTGVTINVGSGSLNPFFGGVGVANNVDLQPFRVGTSGIDTILNFTAGDILNGSTTTIASPGGFGGSIDHVGDTFTAGNEGYIGFKLNGTNYGWMRVVFTNNTSGAVVKDWAYDNSGAAIAVGNITHSGSTVTANSSFGDFTVGSVLADSGGTTNLLKTGTGTLTLAGNNTYTGTTTVSAGTLYLTGALSAASAVSIDDNATLGGDGSMGALTFEGGAFFDIFEAVTNDSALSASTIAFATTGFGIDNLVYEGSAIDWSAIDNGTYTLISGTMDSSNLANLGLENAFDIGSGRSAYFAGSSLQLVVIPEPGVAILGSLGLLVMMRRRRA